MAIFTSERWSIGLYMWLRAFLLVVVGFYIFAFALSLALGLTAPELARNPQVVRAVAGVVGLFVGLPTTMFVLNHCGKVLAHRRFGYAITRFIGWSLFWRVALWHWLMGIAIWTAGISVVKVFQALHFHYGAVSVGIVLIFVASAASILAYGWITKHVVTLYGQRQSSI